MIKKLSKNYFLQNMNVDNGDLDPQFFFLNTLEIIL